MASTSVSCTNKLFSVTGKNVLVTGGSRGIGKMIAKGFSDCGANVLIASRDEKMCRAAAQDCNAQYVVSNVGKRDECQALADKVREIFQGRLDVLINNAGTSWGEPLERNSKQNWGFDKVLDVNVKGMFYLTNFCHDMLERPTNEDPGRVVNIGSVAGIVPQEAPTHAYDVSKAAVHQLTKKLAGDLAPKNITVNCLAPGYVETRMSQGLASWGGSVDSIAKNVPMGRMGQEGDMAGACIYLSSPAAAWITGVILTVDGGTLIRPIPLASL